MFVRRALVCWFCSYKFGANKGRAFHKSTPIGDMTKKKTGSSKYYAVARGRRTGIFRSWEECSEQVHGYPLARFKSFRTRPEAVTFIEANGGSSSAPSHGNAAATGRTISSATRREAAATGNSIDQNGAAALYTGPILQPSLRVASAAPRSASNNPYERRMRHIGGIHVTAASALRAAGSGPASSSAAAPQARRSLQIHINFDGGSRGNPGIAGAGAAITLSSDRPLPSPDREDADSSEEPFRRTLHVRHFVSRQTTNNVAEYQGLLSALRVARKQVLDLLFDPSGKAPPLSELKLVIQGDSKLVIEQLLGSWKCRHPNLQPLHAEAVNLIEDFRRMSPGKCRVVYEHILREYNSLADGLANEAMDAQRSWVTSSDEGNHSVQRKLEDVSD